MPVLFILLFPFQSGKVICLWWYSKCISYLGLSNRISQVGCLNSYGSLEYKIKVSSKLVSGTKSHRLGMNCYKQQKFVSHSSGGWKSESKVPAWPVEGPLLLRDSLCFHIAGRGQGTLWGLFHKYTNPIPEGSTVMI